RKYRTPVRIKLLQIDVPIRQRVQTRRAEKRLARLDQENRLRKTIVMETAAEMHARFDHHDFEDIKVGHQRLQRRWFHDLHKIGAEDQDIVAAELDADPELAIILDRFEDRALDAQRLACGLIDQAADLHVEGVA